MSMAAISEKLKVFCDRWQEVVIWLPISIGALVFAGWLLPQVDPSAGIDGPGFLYGLSSILVTFSVAGFIAWLAQITYGTELGDDRKGDLITEARHGNWCALCLLVSPWVQWMIVFWLVWEKLA